MTNDFWLDSTADRLDYCDDCRYELSHCRCAVDAVAVSVQDVEAALDSLIATLPHLTTNDQAMRLHRVLAELELKMTKVSDATLRRADALCGEVA